MNAEDLLLSTKSLLDLQKMQAEMEGRDFDVADAMTAVRPALESVLGELLDLQRAAGDSNPVCPHCGCTPEPQLEDMYGEDYDNMDVQEVIDQLDEFNAEELKVVHKHEKQNQKRSQVLSAIQSAYAIVANGGKIDEASESEHVAETEKQLEKMFDDLFKK